MTPGRGAACQDWREKYDGRRRAGMTDLGAEGFPCWSQPERDMGPSLDLESGSVVRLKYGPYRKMRERDASTLNRHIAWAGRLWLDWD